MKRLTLLSLAAALVVSCTGRDLDPFGGGASEAITWNKIAGIIICVAGLVLINWK